jgi:uncharacterized protein DUF4136
MRRLLMLISLAGIAATTAGCLTLMPVSSQVDRSADFTRYHTYDWGPADALPATDVRLGENPFFVDDVHGAIDTELTRRGLVRASAERADLLVHYHAAVTGRVEVEPRQSTRGPVQGQLQRDCVGDDCVPRVTGYEAGTLVIDIVDTASGRLVWRGWAEHRLEDMLDDPTLVHRRVHDAVRRVFERLPLAAITEPGGAAREGIR